MSITTRTKAPTMTIHRITPQRSPRQSNERRHTAGPGLELFSAEGYRAISVAFGAPPAPERRPLFDGDHGEIARVIDLRMTCLSVEDRGFLAEIQQLRRLAPKQEQRLNDLASRAGLLQRQ